VIVTYATGVFAAQNATRTIPIVMATAAYVVAMGTVASLAHPGGNITGLTFFFPELMAKRLALLKEVVPSMTKAGVLLLGNNPSTGNVLEAMGETAKALQIGLQPAEILVPKDLETTFAAWDNEQIGGFVMTDHAQVLAHANTIVVLAKKYAIPSIGRRRTKHRFAASHRICRVRGCSRSGVRIICDSSRRCHPDWLRSSFGRMA
jgi:putative tryptophan/tyrosine transport system substrate-binding protein